MRSNQLCIFLFMTLLKFREVRDLHRHLGSLDKSLQSSENKDADLVFVAVRLKVCPVNYDSTAKCKRFLISTNRELQKLLLLCLFQDCVKVSPKKCTTDICRFGLKVTYFLYLRLPHWSGVRGPPASHPDRLTDLPPLLLAPCHQPGAMSPQPAPLEKNKGQRELISLHEKKGPFIQEANCKPQGWRGEKTPNSPQTHSSISPLFFCVVKLSIFIHHEKIIVLQKGQNWSIILLLPRKDYHDSRDWLSHFHSN